MIHVLCVYMGVLTYHLFSVGAHYLQYSGPIFRRVFNYMTKYKADGRVMVDGVSFTRCNPRYDGKVV